VSGHAPDGGPAPPETAGPSQIGKAQLRPSAATPAPAPAMLPGVRPL